MSREGTLRLSIKNTLGTQDVGGVGRDRVGARKYTPLYKNGIKKTQNKSMEPTLWYSNLSCSFQI